MIDMNRIARDPQNAALAMPKLRFSHIQQCRHAWLSQHLHWNQDLLALFIVFAIDQDHRNKPFWDLLCVTTSGDGDALGTLLP